MTRLTANTTQNKVSRGARRDEPDLAEEMKRDEGKGRYQPAGADHDIVVVVVVADSSSLKSARGDKVS